MKLIVLAHYGEAQVIIDEYSLSKKSEELYQNDELTVLLTGEGPFEATARVSRLLANGGFSEVINLGIAGSLDHQLSLNEIHSVRTVYLAIEGKPQFKSFELAREGVDVVTSFERLLDPDKARPLKGLAHLVDRELWGVAFACKEQGVPFRSFKLISDEAGTLGACEVVKGEAFKFSTKLCEKLNELLKREVPLALSSSFPEQGNDFYFTFSLKHKFQNLLHRLTLRDQISEKQVLEQLPIAELKNAKLSPKLRAKALVEELEILLDPFKGKLHQALHAWKKKYQGIELITDPSWENPEIKFSFAVKNEEELQEKMKILKTVELKSFHDILEGRVHVE